MMWYRYSMYMIKKFNIEIYILKIKCLPIIVPTVYYSFQCLKYMSKTSKKLTRSQFLELLDMNEFWKIFWDFRGPHQITIPTKVWDLLWSGNFQGFERVPDRFPNQRLIDVLSQLESRSRANLFHDQQGNIWSTDWILFWKSIYKSHQIVHDSQSE